MNALKIEFGFGTGLTKFGATLSPAAVLQGLEAVDDKALQLFGGFTRIRTEGAWRDEKRDIVFREEGQTLFVFVQAEDLNAAKNRIPEMVETIKNSLFQEAVAVSWTQINTEVL